MNTKNHISTHAPEQVYALVDANGNFECVSGMIYTSLQIKSMFDSYYITTYDGAFIQVNKYKPETKEHSAKYFPVNDWSTKKYVRDMLTSILKPDISGLAVYEIADVILTHKINLLIIR